MNRNQHPSIGRYVLIAVVIFTISIIISIAAKCILIFDTRIFFFEQDQVLLITSMIEGAVGAIAAAFVLYQLKSNQEVELHENEIHEAEFYQTFINYWIEADNLFVQYPECRKYFYDGADVSELDPESDEFQRVMAITEYFDDLFRYSKTQVSNNITFGASIPQDQIDSFNVYIKNMQQKPVFEFYKNRYGQWVNSTDNYHFPDNDTN